MSTLEIKVEPFAIDVSFTADDLVVVLADGSRVSVPLASFPASCEPARTAPIGN